MSRPGGPVAFDGSSPAGPRVVSGPDRLSDLPALLDDLGAGRPVLVTSPSMRCSNVVARLEDTLGDRLAGIHGTVSPHAPIEDVRRLQRTFESAGADSVLSIGGASVTDAAKALVSLSPEGSCRHIAVPALFGGSEVTPRAGVLDGGDKRRLSGQHLVPIAVVLDPSVPASLPTRLLRPSIGNAVAHCLEGVVSVDASPFSDAAYLHALALLWHAAIGVESGAPDKTFGALQAGAVLAGTPRVRMGVAHALVHALSPLLNIPHATAHSIVMRVVASRNVTRLPDRFRPVVHVLGHPDPWSASDQALARWFDAELTSWLTGLGISLGLRELGVAEADLKAVLPGLCSSIEAVLPPGDGTDAAEIEEVTWRCWHGDPQRQG